MTTGRGEGNPVCPTALIPAVDSDKVQKVLHQCQDHSEYSVRTSYNSNNETAGRGQIFVGSGGQICHDFLHFFFFFLVNKDNVLLIAHLSKTGC